MAVLFVSASEGLADSGPATAEYQRKAQLICGFIRYVKWPEKKFITQNAPLVIGIVGTDRVSDSLREMLQELRFEGRPVHIKQIEVREELSKCHIVFVSKSERDRLDPILREVRRANVLSIGETENFIS